jgi:hypothetical protein
MGWETTVPRLTGDYHHKHGGDLSVRSLTSAAEGLSLPEAVAGVNVNAQRPNL